jgi:hypothetical protein
VWEVDDVGEGVLPGLSILKLGLDEREKVRAWRPASLPSSDGLLRDTQPDCQLTLAESTTVAVLAQGRT